MRKRLFGCVAASMLMTFPAGAVIIGQVDTFDTDTEGWSVGAPGHPKPPVQVPDGGPGGTGDGFLQLTALGGETGPGSRLAVLSGPQWAGDYIAAGIGAIALDVRNEGPEDLFLRLLFQNFEDPGPPADSAVTEAVFVPSGSGWMRIVFNVSPGALTAIGPPTSDVSGALMGADTIRIFHNPDADFTGPPSAIPTVNAVLDVDNIAAGVPEPSTVLLTICGLALLIVKRLRTC